MAIKPLYTALIYTLVLMQVKPQTGGNNVYEFLNLTHSGFTASTGGVNVSLRNSDPNMAWNNPALLNDETDKALVLNFVNYFAGINYGSVLYPVTFPKEGTFGAGIIYLNYGSFREADESGNITGSFSASEYAFSFMWSHNIDSLFSAGICFKPVLSHLEKYTSTGFAFDIGLSWHSADNLTFAGMVIRNAGLQLTTYDGESREKLPFEIQAGISWRLAHAPFRVSLTLRHLEKFDLTYEYPGSITSGTSSQSGFGENLFRHLITGVELIPHKNIWLAAGYNHQRRRELQVESCTSTTGFTWGFGIKTSAISLGFGRANFHLAGSSNHFSLTVRPDRFYKKFRN